jgi:hypothetical protein
MADSRQRRFRGRRHVTDPLDADTERGATVLSKLTPPPPKEGWQHSENVLVYYASRPPMYGERWSIAYYHHAPEHEHWVDLNNPGEEPTAWWSLPRTRCPASEMLDWNPRTNRKGAWILFSEAGRVLDLIEGDPDEFPPGKGYEWHKNGGHRE